MDISSHFGEDDNRCHVITLVFQILPVIPGEEMSKDPRKAFSGGIWETKHRSSKGYDWKTKVIQDLL